MKLLKEHMIGFLCICFIGCKPFLKVPAISKESMNASEELKYIHYTDQLDRRRTLLRALLLSEKKLMKNKKEIALNNRDSIRLSRVIELHNHGLIQTDDDKFYTAFTYFHGGGIKMGPDSLYYRIAYELFKDLAENGKSEHRKKSGEYYKRIVKKYWMQEIK